MSEGKVETTDQSARNPCELPAQQTTDWRAWLCRLFPHRFEPIWEPDLTGAICTRCGARRPLTAAEQEDIDAEACT
jgi:hypothetical protein